MDILLLEQLEKAKMFTFIIVGCMCEGEKRVPQLLLNSECKSCGGVYRSRL